MLRPVAVLLAVVCLLLNGCRPQHSLAPDKIVIKSGNHQTGRPGTVLPKPLVVEVLSTLKRGFLGGKGSRYGVEGVKVYFQPQGDSGLAVRPQEVLTDHGGRAKAYVTLGPHISDGYIKAYCRLSGHVTSVLFRVTSGVVLQGQNQEGAAGQQLPEPLAVQLYDQDKPLAGIQVYFRIAGEGHGARLSSSREVTNEQGIACTRLTLGNKTSRYYVDAEIADPQHGLYIRSVRFQAMAVHRSLLLISLIGGLAIFIFGMRMMSQNLQLVAGDRLRSALHFFTKNRFSGILAGAVVTAAIQSSSACTVMTVGFVNAGLLGLQEAISVVLGANIGTTFTAQIISFKLNDLAFPAIALGLGLNMLAHSKTKKFWGQVLIGFGLLFLGMTVMDGALKPLKHSPSFIEFFKGFNCAPVNGQMPLDNVLWAIFIGTVMTIAIQSSSATIGLALALAGSGLINFYTAVPLILGDNIGTTSTAMIAAIGTNRTSRRAACAHFLFNMVGVAYMLALFYVPYHGQPVFLSIVDSLTAGDVFAPDPENIERHIAMAHTLFNVFNVLVFIPLIGFLTYLTTRLIRKSADEEPDQVSYLEVHLLSTPPIAIAQAIKETAYMTRLAWKNIRDAFDALMNNNLQHEAKILKREANIDHLQHEITDYLVQLSQRQLNEEEAVRLPQLIHIVNDAERVGDQAINILELAEARHERKIDFSPMAIKELTCMYGLVHAQFENLIQAFDKGDVVYARVVMEQEKKINEMEKSICQQHTKRLETGECSISAGIIFLELITNFEKIGDRFNNIAERVACLVPAHKLEQGPKPTMTSSQGPASPSDKAEAGTSQGS